MALDRQQATETNFPTISTPESFDKNNQGSDRVDVIKPVTIMSLDDRDIVVIDKADIKDATKHEGNVIVVNTQQNQQNEIDLVDLLGGNWPEHVCDAALVLNKVMQNQHSEQQQGIVGTFSKTTTSINHSLEKLTRNKGQGVFSSNLSTFHNLKQGGLLMTQKPEEISKAVISNSPIGSGAPYKVLKFKEMDKASVYDNVINAELNISTTAEEGSIQHGEDLSLTSITLENPPTGLGVGSMVEISIAEVSEDIYGVIRWIGAPLGSKSVMIGVELEDNQENKQLQTTDGSFNGISLFKCQEGRALLVDPSQCSIDRRFVDVEDFHFKNLNSKKQKDTKMFGQVECPSVPGAVSPLKIYNLDELKDICGKFKGIQGHHNSCYLDATLFSMFTFTHVFDSLLFRPSEPDDILHYDEVQKVLREEIVNPLRRNVFVRADRVMKLRQLLDKLSSVSGLTSEEKDPEEFLNSLLAQIMRVEPFLKLSSGQDAYFHQLFVEKDERLLFPSVQQLFEQSFQSSDIKLKEVPSCLIIQMPRFGKNFKMYSRILPSQVLDVTDVIDDSPRQCSVCGKLSEYECRDCFGILQCGVGLESTAFCGKCLETVHLHTKRANHSHKKINTPYDFKIMADHMSVPRLYMELFAVVCIETSHYVAFVKAGSGPDAPWCFFDSMADRKGEKNGYNIPEINTIPDLPLWLSEEGARTVNEMSSNDKMLPEYAKRLFCDAYMCMYQSTDVMMYR